MLSIGAFSKISKVTANTLRYYDEIGLIKPILVNNENGYRYYDIKQLNTILLINKLKLYSFSLEEIADVLKEPYDSRLLLSIMNQKQQKIQKERNHLEYALNQLQEDISNLERGINIMSYLDEIEVKLVETQPKNILYIREQMSVQNYERYMTKLFDTLKNEQLTMTGNPMNIFHEEEDFNPQCYDNEIAVPVKEAGKGTRILPGGLCAMAALKGAYTKLPSIYAKLKQWVESEGFAVRAEVYEIYITDPGQTLPEENITEVYVPVKKE